MQQLGLYTWATLHWWVRGGGIDLCTPKHSMWHKSGNIHLIDHVAMRLPQLIILCTFSIAVGYRGCFLLTTMDDNYAGHQMDLCAVQINYFMRTGTMFLSEHYWSLEAHMNNLTVKVIIINHLSKSTLFITKITQGPVKVDQTMSTWINLFHIGRRVTCSKASCTWIKTLQNKNHTISLSCSVLLHYVHSIMCFPSDSKTCPLKNGAAFWTPRKKGL